MKEIVWSTARVRSYFI